MCFMNPLQSERIFFTSLPSKLDRLSPRPAVNPLQSRASVPPALVLRVEAVGDECARPASDDSNLVGFSKPGYKCRWLPCESEIFSAWQPTHQANYDEGVLDRINPSEKTLECVDLLEHPSSARTNRTLIFRNCALERVLCTIREFRRNLDYHLNGCVWVGCQKPNDLVRDLHQAHFCGRRRDINGAVEGLWSGVNGRSCFAGARPAWAR